MSNRICSNLHLLSSMPLTMTIKPESSVNNKNNINTINQQQRSLSSSSASAVLAPVSASSSNQTQRREKKRARRQQQHDLSSSFSLSTSTTGRETTSVAASSSSSNTTTTQEEERPSRDQLELKLKKVLKQLQDERNANVALQRSFKNVHSELCTVKKERDDLSDKVQQNERSYDICLGFCKDLMEENNQLISKLTTSATSTRASSSSNEITTINTATATTTFNEASCTLHVNANDDDTGTASNGLNWSVIEIDMDDEDDDDDDRDDYNSIQQKVTELEPVLKDLTIDIYCPPPKNQSKYHHQRLRYLRDIGEGRKAALITRGETTFFIHKAFPMSDRNKEKKRITRFWYSLIPILDAGVTLESVAAAFDKKGTHPEDMKTLHQYIRRLNIDKYDGPNN